jgi:hypothetical protein
MNINKISRFEELRKTSGGLASWGFVIPKPNVNFKKEIDNSTQSRLPNQDFQQNSNFQDYKLKHQQLMFDD